MFSLRAPPACRGYASIADRITAGCPLLAAPARAPEQRVSLGSRRRQSNHSRLATHSRRACGRHKTKLVRFAQNLRRLMLSHEICSRATRPAIICPISPMRLISLAPQESELPTAATASAEARHARRSSLSPGGTSDTCSAPNVSLTSALTRSAMNLHGPFPCDHQHRRFLRSTLRAQVRDFLAAMAAEYFPGSAFVTELLSELGTDAPPPIRD